MTPVWPGGQQQLPGWAEAVMDRTDATPAASYTASSTAVTNRCTVVIDSSVASRPALSLWRHVPQKVRYFPKSSGADSA